MLSICFFYLKIEGMENQKSNAVIEIGSSSIKIALGDISTSQEPILQYYKEIPLENCLGGGLILDKETIIENLKKIRLLEDESVSLRASITSASLVLPPVGLKIFQSDKMTNVIANDGCIEQIDISNVISLIEKSMKTCPDAIVDIVPDYFQLSENRLFKRPPLGEKNPDISVHAKIHTLPNEILDSYRGVLQEAGLRTKFVCTAPYCGGSLIARDISLGRIAIPSNLKSDLYRYFFYIDMGARLTSVSIIHDGSVYASFLIEKGGDELTEEIASSLGISFKEAKDLKERFGFDLRNHEFSTPIAKSVDEEGKPISFRQKDLNKIIERYFESYDSLLSNALDTVVYKMPEKVRQVLHIAPLFFSGGASKLYGLTSLIKKSIQSHPVHFYAPHVIGARRNELTNLIGIMYAETEYHGTNDNSFHGVSQLTRETTHQGGK